MIVSHRHKFIFIAIPKTGTQSIRRILRPHLGKYDWEQCNLFEKKLFPIPSIAKMAHGHISLSQLYDALEYGMLDGYFSFCFMRDPIDRFLSACYFYFKQKMLDHPERTVEKILYGEYNHLLTNHFLWRSQSSMIMDRNNELQVSYIAKFEKMDKEVVYLQSKLNLPFSAVQIVNSAERSEKEISAKLRYDIAKIYEADFNLYENLD